MSKMQAVEDLKLFFKKLQPLASAIDVLEKIGSLENAVVEAEKKQVAAYAKADEALQAQVKQEAELSNVMGDIKQKKQECEVYIVKAKEKAASVLKDAEAAAKGIEEVAFAKLQEAEALRAEFANINNAVQKEIEEKRIELSELQNKISDVKIKLANFLK
jgi:hypothetical protein